MLQNAYLLAKIGADTTENEQHLGEMLPIARRVPMTAEPAPARASAAGRQAGALREPSGRKVCPIERSADRCRTASEGHASPHRHDAARQDGMVSPLLS